MSDENEEGGSDMDAWNEALSEQADGESGDDDDPWAAALSEQSDAEKQDFDTLTDSSEPTSGDHPSIDVIMEIPVSISMEVGKTDITIRNLLKLNQGSVVELDRFAGDPLDVYVNNNLIAHGEVVVVNEKFGIRLTDIVSSAERIDKLGEFK